MNTQIEQKLSEIETRADEDLRLTARDVPALVQALRRACELLEYADEHLHEKYANWRPLADIAAILSGRSLDHGKAQVAE